MTNHVQTAPAVFQFQSQEVRVIVRDGEPWFVAKDICSVIGHTNVTEALRNLDDDEKGLSSTETLGGTQSLNIINESGMYALVLRSRDAMKQGTVQHTFRKWITSEVLPSIRKTGKYSLGDGQPSETEIAALLERVAELEDLVHILLQQRLATPKAPPLSDEDIHALTLQRNRIMSKKTLRAAQNPAYAKRTTLLSGNPHPSAMRFFCASMKGIRQFNGGLRAPNKTPSGNKRRRLSTVVESRHSIFCGETK